MADNQNDTKYFEERIQELGAERNWKKDEIKEKIAYLQNLKTPEAMKEYLNKLEQEDEQQPNNDNREDGNQSDKIDVDEGQKDDSQQKKQAEGQEGEEKSQVPVDEFKEFLKDQKVSVLEYMNASPEKQKQLQDAFKAKFPDIEQPMRDAKSTTVGEKEEDINSSQNSDWREMRRKAWKEYAKENDQPFEEISKAEDADLSMKVGDTPIHYQDKSHLTMGNGEYEKFVKAVQIEKAAETDIINFGNIQSEEYKAKLAAACIQEGMLMKNGPKSIDLNLECFKDLKPEVKDKIEAWNRVQAAREAAQEEKKPQQSQQEAQQATENQGEQKPVENQGEQKPVESQGEQKPVKKDYKQMFDDKVAELKAAKAAAAAENKEFRLDMSQYKSIDERIIAFAATKEAHVAIDNLKIDEHIKGEGTSSVEFSKKTLKEIKDSLPETIWGAVERHDEMVTHLKKVRKKLQSGKMKRGQYHDDDGNIKEATLTMHDSEGNAYQEVKRKDVQFEYVDGRAKIKTQNITKEEVAERVKEVEAKRAKESKDGKEQESQKKDPKAYQGKKQFNVYVMRDGGRG